MYFSENDLKFKEYSENLLFSFLIAIRQSVSVFKRLTMYRLQKISTGMWHQETSVQLKLK